MSLLVFAILVLLAPETAHAENSPVTLSLELDGARYLPDQPILVLACVQNESADTLVDLAPLYPDAGMLKLQLRRNGDTQPVQPGIQTIVDMILPTEGLRLPPGESQCEALNLLHWFGPATTETSMVGQRGLRMRLPPGRYVLSADMSAHTGNRKGLAQLRLRSGEVHFEVLDVDPRDADPYLAKLLERSPPVGSVEFRQYCAQWFPRAYRSPNFMAFYYTSGMSRAAVPIDSILEGLREAAASPVRIASVAFVYAKVARLGDAEKLAWIQRLRLQFPGMELMRRVAETWEARLTQRLYYHPEGP